MDKALLTCSFCGVSQAEQKLVTAANVSQICSRCISDFKRALEEEPGPLVYICSFCLAPTDKGLGDASSAIICTRCVKEAKRTMEEFDLEAGT